MIRRCAVDGGARFRWHVTMRAAVLLLADSPVQRDAAVFIGVTTEALLAIELIQIVTGPAVVRVVAGHAGERFGLLITLALPHLIKMLGKGILRFSVLRLISDPGICDLLSRNKVPDALAIGVNHDITVQMTLSRKSIPISFGQACPDLPNGQRQGFPIHHACFPFVIDDRPHVLHWAHDTVHNQSPIQEPPGVEADHAKSGRHDRTSTGHRPRDCSRDELAGRSQAHRVVAIGAIPRHGRLQQVASVTQQVGFGKRSTAHDVLDGQFGQPQLGIGLRWLGTAGAEVFPFAMPQPPVAADDFVGSLADRVDQFSIGRHGFKVDFANRSAVCGLQIARISILMTLRARLGARVAGRPRCSFRRRSQRGGCFRGDRFRWLSGRRLIRTNRLLVGA